MKSNDVVAYIHTELGEDASISEERLKMIEQDCRNQERNLVAVFRDDGVPSHVPFAARPAGKLLLKAAKHRLFSAVIICTVDQMGRDIRGNEVIVHELYHKHGVKILGVKQKIDLTTSFGRFAFVFDQDMRKLKSQTDGINWLRCNLEALKD